MLWEMDISRTAALETSEERKKGLMRSHAFFARGNDSARVETGRGERSSGIDADLAE